MSAAHLHVLPHPQERPRDAAGTSGDLGLLAFLLSVHAVPLIALAVGAGWGPGTVGYGTAVAVLAARELVRELGTRLTAGRHAAR